MSFIGPPGEHSKALIVNHAKAQTIRTDLIGIGYTFPTAPWNELGPFYKKSAPQTVSLRAPGDPGMPLSVSGQVFDVQW